MAGNPFAYASGDALRQQALLERERLAGRDLGDLPKLSPFKSVLNALVARKTGLTPFETPPLPQLNMTELMAENPELQAQLESMDPAQRFLLFAERPEQLAALMAAPEGVFERIFPRFGGITTPSLVSELELQQARVRGGAGLPPGGLQAAEERNALDIITDETNRALLEAGYAGSRGVLPPEVAQARAQQVFGTAQAEAEAAALQPEQAAATLAGTRATTRKTAADAAAAERGDLLVFVDPSTNQAIASVYETDPRAEQLRAQGAIPFVRGSLSVQGTTTAGATGSPGKAEVAKAGEQARANVAIEQRVQDILGRVAAAPGRAFGPLGDLARENRGIALFDSASPAFADAVNVLVTGMPQGEFSQLKADVDLLTTQLVPPITQETSRYSDSERKMVGEIGGATSGTSKSAYMGKLKALRDLILLNSDKHAMIAGTQAPEYGDLFGKPAAGSKLTPAGQALMQKLIGMGYTPQESARMYRRIAAQRRELAVRGARALDGTLDELLGQDEPQPAKER